MIESRRVQLLKNNIFNTQTKKSLTKWGKLDKGDAQLANVKRVHNGSFIPPLSR